MSKEEEIMAYLNAHVFEPVLSSPTASERLKQGVRLTILRLEKRDAAGMLSYYWSAISGTDRSIGFAKLMKAEGYVRFEEILEDFRERFSDRWLRR